MKALSQDEFVARGEAANPGKYDFSKTRYRNARTKIVVICVTCGHEWSQRPRDNLAGVGCPKCSGRDCTLDDFVRKARAKHGDKHDYSNVEYAGSFIPVTIRCRICDHVFEQKPANHLFGQGCPSCVTMAKFKYSQVTFLEAAHVANDGRYDYSDTVFTKLEAKVMVRCRACDIVFEQWAREHLKGRNSCPGCGVCGHTLVRFVREAQAEHGDRYDYSDVEYIHSNVPVKIICRTCQTTFEQRPCNHLGGQGCPTCAGKRKGQYLKEEARGRFERHARDNANRYDYSRAEYVTNRTKMLIGCLTCGEDFWQTPFAHVVVGNGCPTCAKRAFTSKGEIAWLDELDIPLEARNRYITLSNGRRTNVDAYHDGIVYEHYGRYWHGDPRTTDQENIHAFIQLPMSQVYANTIARHEQLLVSGYEVRFVWEDDRLDGQLFSECHPHEHEKS